MQDSSKARTSKSHEFQLRWRQYIWTYVINTKNKNKMALKCKWNGSFIAEFERAAKIRKIAVYRFLISYLIPELKRFKDE